MCTVIVQIHRHFSDPPLVMQLCNRGGDACVFIPGISDWGESNLLIV